MPVSHSVSNSSISVGTIAASGGIGAFTTNVTPGNTSNFRAAVRANSRNVRVAVIGDSTDRGQSTGVGTAQAVNSWPNKTADLIQNQGITAGANSVFSDGGSWGQAQTFANFLTGDSRVSGTGAWALGATKGPGGNLFTSSATGSMSVVFPAQVDTADIYWRDGATGRNFNWQVDGGATTEIDSTNVTQLAKNTISLGSAGSHTITLNWVLGAVTILGIHAYNSARKEISIWNWGICGGTSANMIDNTDTAVGRLAVLSNSLIKPDLIFLEGGVINDWRTSVAVATTVSNLQSLITTAKNNSIDVIIRIPTFDNGVSGLTAQQNTYVQAMYQLANDNNIGVVDIRNKWLSYNNAVSNGWNISSDTVHPAPAGYVDIANVISNLIISIR